MEKYDILTLDNGKDYTISQITEYDGKKYLLLVEVDEDENILDDKIIVEVNDDNNELAIVEDEHIFKKISSDFTKMVFQDLNLNS